MRRLNRWQTTCLRLLVHLVDFNIIAKCTNCQQSLGVGTPADKCGRIVLNVSSDSPDVFNN